MGGIILLILQLAVLGLIAWLVDQYVPMPPPLKVAVRVIIVLLIVLWLLRAVGLV